VLKAIADQYIKPTGKQKPGLVNIWSPVPYQDPFWAGNLDALKALIASIGLKPNAIFGYGGGTEAIRRVPEAAFNLLVSPWVGLESIRFLETRFGTPFLHYPVLPIGPTETAAFLRTLGDYARISPSIVEAAISGQEERYYHYAERIGDFLFESRSGQPTRFITVCDSSYATGISRFLTGDLGLIPDLQFVTDDPPEEFQPAIESAFQNVVDGITAQVIFTNDGGVVRDTLRAAQFYGRPFLIGTTWDRVAARELNAYPLSISMPVTDRLILNRTYVGYDGALRLLEDLFSTVLSDYQ
jgi:nitrogenase molybdenum-iron protein beta chain